ncbi:MAG: ParB N-terminal domain-containing protein, partial [Patescibacteria group bacterium]
METLVENAPGGEATLAAELLNVPVDQIEFKDRARKAYKDLQSLVKMFREKGIIHPIAVQRQDDPTFPFKLLAGGRRYSAAVLGGFKEIPCRVYPSNLDDLDRREIELMENLGREALDWKEEVWLTEEIHRLQTEKHERNNVGTAAPAYTAADTARLMKTTPMSVSRDRQLAEGLSQP